MSNVRQNKNMKIERYILSVLCGGVCIWAATMVVGVIGLAVHQGAFALLALLEVATFLGAGLLPLLILWSSPEKTNKWAFRAWLLCIGYVTLLSLNSCRIDLIPGAIRFTLWIMIVVLFTRATRDAKPA